MDKVAIVILNWNGHDMMQRYLPSVIEHSRREAAIYVADNGSIDDSLAFLASLAEDVKTIPLDHNYGFAEGYNQALRQVDAQYFILLNSDVEVTPHWLEPLVAYMDVHTDVAACQPKLLAMHDRTQFEYAGAAGGFIDRYGYPFCRGRLFDVVEQDRGQYDDPADLLWATGACLMIRRNDYWAAGGLDGRFFAHNEEIDLCWRLRLMGRRVVCVPAAKVYHVGGGTLPKVNPMKTFLNFRNNLTMLYKNLPDGELRQVMVIRWFLDYLAAWQTLILNRNYRDFLAIYRARRAFRRWLPQFREDRRRIQADRVETQHGDGRSPLSLLYQYYIKGRKRYSDLSF